MVKDKAPKGQEFRLVTGHEVRSVQELLEYLREISQEEYSYHVNDERNDFAAWIKGVHDNHELAERLESAEDKEDAVQLLKEEVKNYYKRQKPKKTKQSKRREKTKETRKPTKDKKKETDHPVSTDHGDFLTKEFIYGAIFGFILGMLAAGILTALG